MELLGSLTFLSSVTQEAFPCFLRPEPWRSDGNTPLHLSANHDDWGFSNNVLAMHALSTREASRRRFLITAVSFSLSHGVAVYAEEGKDEDIESSPLGGILPLFEADEKTRLGKKLPKGYLKSAKEVVKSLRDSLKEGSTNGDKFRKSADSAKEAIRNYLRDWQGDNLVASEDSYKALERALRVLGEFYSKKGPRAMLPADIKIRVFEDLDAADNAL
eukprot:c23510_g1_i1 orf=226-876(-)